MVLQLNWQYIYLKFELLDILSFVVLLRPQESSDTLLSTTHSLKYLVREDTEAHAFHWIKLPVLFWSG